MNDLVEYQRQRIEALENTLSEALEDLKNLQEEYDQLLNFKTQVK